jgi:hypothetical protein
MCDSLTSAFKNATKIEFKFESKIEQNQNLD